MRAKFALTTLIPLVLAAPSLAAQDQRHPLLENEFSASLGAFIINKDVTVTLDGITPGDKIEFDRHWSLGDKQSNIGVSLAYQLFDIDVDVDNNSWGGSVELNYQGPFLSLTATW